MDQAEPYPLPGQPELPGRPGQADAPEHDHEPGSPARPGLPAHPNRPTDQGHAATDPGHIADPGGEAAREPGTDPAAPLARGMDSDHPVVIGYDGSPSSRNALAYAAGLARRLGRPLLVAYVTSPGIYCEPLTGQVIGTDRDAAETTRWLLAELDEVCDRSGLRICIITRRGSPARELAAAADEFHADALVIGAPTHLWHHVAGSVPGWLARHAHCPVIVVP